ncbi:MAG: type IV secretion system protein VirB10 [Steroidobacteraceae bacterium]|jgi:type IV secretion system protein VirB10
MSEERATQTEVAGERGTTLVNRGASVQSRLSSVLALSLMSVLGIGSLTWYYAHSMTRQSRARQSAQSASMSRAQGDAALPSIGRIDPPPPPPVPALDVIMPVDPAADRSAPLAATTLTEIPLSPGTSGGVYGAPPPPTPEQLAQARQLSGAVFSNGSAGAAPASSASTAAPTMGYGLPSAAPSAGSSEPGELAPLLRAPFAASARAQNLPAQRLLLPKGAFIDCTLETAIDSSLPGMTTCILAADTFGVDGKVVLLERGTKLIGETRGQVQQGTARVFVLWTEARTPTGVVVPLDSPAADELGRSGLPGEVNRHFWERFGAAMLISVVDGAVQTAATRNSGGTVIVDPSASQGVMTEVLKGTVNIPPTVTKKNGDRIEVLVARDVDFRSVYELRSVAGR